MSLSKEQITYISRRVEQEGIETPELRNDMIDHICCAVEAKMKASSNFEEIFNQVFADFCPEQGLTAIDVEIKYLSNYKWIVMKKIILSFVFVLSMLFFLSTLINGIGLANNYDWPFMKDLAFFNQYAICLFILPVYWLHQYKIAQKEVNDGLSSKGKLGMFVLGFLCAEALTNAVFLKLMHMPGGNHLLIITAILGICYVPLYMISKYRLALK
jgi:hypothetical protein